MIAIVTSEYRFARTPDGAVWTDMVFDEAFWGRYVGAFSALRVVARVRDVPAPPPNGKRVDSANVQFVALPHYIGPLGYLKQRRRIRRVLRSLDRSAAYILRVPSQIASLTLRVVRPLTYAVEVVGDPHDVFAPGVVSHPLRAVFRWRFARELRSQCRGAKAVAYVTERTLQERYPPRPAEITARYSSIELGEAAFVSEPRRYSTALKTPRLIGVGSLEQRYKGFDVLIRAASTCRDRGLDVSVTIVGGGRYESELRSLAVDVRVPVSFTGSVAGAAAVRDRIDGADLFVLSSRTEGLPRVLIESMARGLPAVATNVGGVPEVAHPDALIPADDIDRLADKIVEMCSSPEMLNSHAARNLEFARRYSSDVLNQRRSEFYSAYAEVARKAATR